MNHLVFSPRELGGKYSPFLLTIDEWRQFANYLNNCISAPTRVDQLRILISNIHEGKFIKSWDSLIQRDSFRIGVEEATAFTSKVKEECDFWDNGGHKGILILSQNIVAFADLITIKYYNDLNQIISEALNGKLSPNTKSKFVNICKDLSNHAQTYYQQSQSMATSISEFYSVILECDAVINKCKPPIINSMRTADDYVVVNNIFRFLFRPLTTMAIYRDSVLPIIRKVHRIWSAISYDLKDTADNIEDIENLEEFIAALELELAFEDWKQIRDEAENFYKNASNIS
ncbi:hypothetical protein [Paenibacillus glacialis]|uniref:Uncharacterized protein n=1 Tax=Paenibacillus glacialis TaxID=494026 RepID=A0A168KKZ1_9BACL|nr:hypothetical protein [Paenibacillus glacialis]OAB42159.1 hypothetical protein PGLA_13585 [Paenibacillus glacialis]